MLASNSVQEADGHGARRPCRPRSRARVPFLHFFDGFRTSHEIQKIDDDRLMRTSAKLIPAEKRCRVPRPRAESGAPASLGGTAQNPDIYFQSREAANKYYDAVPGDRGRGRWTRSRKITGRQYKPFDYVGAPDAENVIVAMGSGCERCDRGYQLPERTMGEKVGLVKRSPVSSVLHQALRGRHPGDLQAHRRARPHQGARLPGRAAVPRCRAPRSSRQGRTRSRSCGGRYGLGSKEFTPSHGQGCVSTTWLDAAEEPLHRRHCGRCDRHSRLPTRRRSQRRSGRRPSAASSVALAPTAPSAPTRTPSRSSATTPICMRRAYFSYDSKKSGGMTVSHLRFGKTPIQSTYLIDAADFVACHNPSLHRRSTTWSPT